MKTVIASLRKDDFGIPELSQFGDAAHHVSPQDGEYVEDGVDTYEYVDEITGKMQMTTVPRRIWNGCWFTVYGHAIGNPAYHPDIAIIQALSDGTYCVAGDDKIINLLDGKMLEEAPESAALISGNCGRANMLEEALKAENVVAIITDRESKLRIIR